MGGSRAGAWLLGALLCASGCASSGSSGGDEDGGRRIDAAAPPADAAPPDAGSGPDGAVDTPAPPGQEIVSAAGRLSSGSIVMDVELGHWVEQSKAFSGTRVLEGAAVIKK